VELHRAIAAEPVQRPVHKELELAQVRDAEVAAGREREDVVRLGIGCFGPYRLASGQPLLARRVAATGGDYEQRDRGNGDRTKAGAQVHMPTYLSSNHHAAAFFPEVPARECAGGRSYSEASSKPNSVVRSDQVSSS